LPLFNAPATTVIYTLSLHDALPISKRGVAHLFSQKPALKCSIVKGSPCGHELRAEDGVGPGIEFPLGSDFASEHREAPGEVTPQDRKSTRLNSSHVAMPYSVFCLKQ